MIDYKTTHDTRAHKIIQTTLLYVGFAFAACALVLALVDLLT